MSESWGIQPEGHQPVSQTGLQNPAEVFSVPLPANEGFQDANVQHPMRSSGSAVISVSQQNVYSVSQQEDTSGKSTQVVTNTMMAETTQQRQSFFPTPPNQSQSNDMYSNGNHPPQIAMQSQQPSPSSAHHVPGSQGSNASGGQNTQEGIRQLLDGVGAPDNVFTSFAADYLNNNLGAAEGYVQSRLHTWIPVESLRYYFNVNTSYVLNKIGRILVPFGSRSRRWSRTMMRSDKGEVLYLPPRDDINAPDLYIPLMAIITYVLIVGFAMGTAGEFTPETLAATFSSGIVILILHLLVLKGGLYILPNNADVGLLDLIAYHGYTYVGVILTVLTVIFLPSWVQWTAWLITSLCMAKFMVETFKTNIQRNAPDNASPSARRNYFLLTIGLFQFILGYVLTNI